MTTPSVSVLSREVIRLRQEVAERDDLLKERAEWYAVKIGHLREQIEIASKFHGRNQVKATDFDLIDRSNRDTLGKWMRFSVLPWVKFFTKSMFEYSEKEKTFSWRVFANDDVIMPDGAIKSAYWRGKILPILNRLVIDYRSTLTGALKTHYMSK